MATVTQKKKTILTKPNTFFDAYERKDGPQEKTHYCPGCGHGIVHKMIAEALEDMELQERTIFISPVGCSVFGYYYFNTGNVQAAHGRAPAVGTGIRRAKPESIVISYQGDGDLAGIGTAEIIHAANRGENMTVIFINNAIYGMTGGQMAPTTLVGQKSTTTPYGRSEANEGRPIRMAELLSTLSAPVFIQRTALTDAKHIMQTRKAIRKALQLQVERKGFSLVEILSPCPVQWKMDPVDSKDWIEKVLTEQFPLGTYRDESETRLPVERKEVTYDRADIKKIIGAVHEEPFVAKEKGTPIPGMENPRFKIAGFGGQGILSLGLLIANAAMYEGKKVSWLPSYGPESRGGTSNCHVKLSDEEIGSPLVVECDVLYAMNQPSYEKFISTVVPGGIVIYEKDQVTNPEPKRDDVTVIPVSSTAMADEAGTTKAVNMINFGLLVGATKLVAKETALAAMKELFPQKKFHEVNNKAFEVGFEFGSKLNLG